MNNFCIHSNPFTNFVDRARRHRVVLFTDDESSTTDDETSYAKKRSSSDAAVIVTDGSDSDTDNGAQNAGENCFFFSTEDCHMLD